MPEDHPGGGVEGGWMPGLKLRKVVSTGVTAVALERSVCQVRSRTELETPTFMGKGKEEPASFP